jgi:hypothetical protein
MKASRGRLIALWKPDRTFVSVLVDDVARVDARRGDDIVTVLQLAASTAQRRHLPPQGGAAGLTRHRGHPCAISHRLTPICPRR